MGENAQDEIEVKLTEQQGVLSADLRVGANLSNALFLRANSNICTKGFEPGHSDFVITKDQRRHLEDVKKDSSKITSLYLNGRELIAGDYSNYLIDAHGLTRDELQRLHPRIFQWLQDRVKPDRETNRDQRLRDNWWLHRRSREDLRQMINGLNRYILTVETSKHRFFTVAPPDASPSNLLVCIAVNSLFYMGILSSRLHIMWALSSGGTLEDRPRYNKSVCFETFPFPDATAELQQIIRDLGERLDAHRQHQQEQFPELTLTGMYNVLEKIRAGETLTDKEKVIHQQGLVSVLREIHDDLDRAVFAAYGWDDLADKLVGLPGATTPLPDKPEAQAEAEEELLKRLVELNAQRAAEEANGYIRWLRPEYQNPDATDKSDNKAQVASQGELAVETGAPTPATKVKKAKWPKQMREQVAAVRSSLEIGELTVAAIASKFNAGKTVPGQIAGVLDALVELGMVTANDGLYSLKS